MPFDREAVVEAYRRRARRYDFTVSLYNLVGIRFEAYRRAAVASLGLREGDTVVDIACGTGRNLGLLERAVGPGGRVVGVDATDAMLDQARRRVEREGWKNVELVACDAARFAFPSPLGGVLSTFALTLVPEYDAVIERGARALAPGRRWAVADLKMPAWRGARLVARVLEPLFRPFAVTLDLADRHPWESMATHMKNVTMSERYSGFVYIATGEA